MKKNMRLDDEELDKLMQDRKTKKEQEEKDREDFIAEIRKQLPDELKGLALDKAETIKRHRAVFEKSFDNMVVFLKQQPRYKGHFWHCQWVGANFTDIFGTRCGALEDDILADIRCNLMKVFEKKFSKDEVETALLTICRENTRNSVTDTIDSLEWDGKRRLETFFIDTVGAEDIDYVRSVTKKWFFAAIKRAYEPGCKFDNMIILQDSKQGTGKTNTIELLLKSLGLERYINNTPSLNPDNKDTLVYINAAWIVLWDELGKAIKFESDSMKNILSKTNDVYRDPYAKSARDHPRKCVFIGTTNNNTFLKDYTDDSERRYWIIPCDGVAGDSAYWRQWSAKYNKEYFRQIWAEAKAMYEDNPDFEYKVLDKEEKETLKRIQAPHRTVEIDPLKEVIIDILDNIQQPQKNKRFGNVKSFIDAFEEVYNGDNISTPGVEQYPLDRIPETYLLAALKKVLHWDKGTNYLKAMLSEHWYKDRVRYKGLLMQCYVKKE